LSKIAVKTRENKDLNCSFFLNYLKFGLFFFRLRSGFSFANFDGCFLINWFLNIYFSKGVLLKKFSNFKAIEYFFETVNSCQKLGFFCDSVVFVLSDLNK
jgi:hypothetical protein